MATTTTTAAILIEVAKVSKVFHVTKSANTLTHTHTHRNTHARVCIARLFLERLRLCNNFFFVAKCNFNSHFVALAARAAHVATGHSAH